jgi:DnaJ-class molecular chaperone
MTDTEYYDILGISKDSDENTIKKAYRKLALKYHPDKASENNKEEYEEKFKEVAHAYGILSDPEKKQLYDQFGKGALDGNGGPGVNPFDIFNDIFGNGGGFGGQGFPPGVHVRMGGHPFGFHQGNFVKKTKDTVIRLEVSLQDIYNGTSREIKVKRNVEGKNEETTLKINIPSGCQDGIKMVKKGAGNKQPEHEPGDVIIVISHEEHPVFNLSENHIIMHKEISFGSSLIGVKFTVKHLSGELITVKIDDLIEDGDLRVIKGKGIPHMRTNEIGDFVIKFSVDKKFTLSNEDKEKLSNIFPTNDFKVDDKATEYEAIDPKNFDDDDDMRGNGQNVQCAQS